MCSREEETIKEMPTVGAGAGRASLEVLARLNQKAKSIRTDREEIIIEDVVPPSKFLKY